MSEEIYDFVLALHFYSLYATGFLMLFYFSLTQGSFKTEFDFIKKIRLFLPIYYLFLAFIIFTGSLLLAFKHFAMSFNTFLMIVCWFAIFALAIFHFIQFKKARRIRHYRVFRFLSFIILLCEIILLILPFGVTYL